MTMKIGKCLAVLCSAAVLVSTLPALAASEPAAYSDADQILYREAVEELTKLGVVSGREDGSFDPKGPVTRAECVKLLAAMLCGGDLDKLPQTSGEPLFSDVAGHWAEGYISYCSGFLNGRGDGTFGPDDIATGAELTKMALGALGYDPMAYELMGTSWELKTNMVATQLCVPSLYQGLERGVDVGDPITREQAAQILDNLLDNTVIRSEPHYYHRDEDFNLTDVITDSYGPLKDENGQDVTFRTACFGG